MMTKHFCSSKLIANFKPHGNQALRYNDPNLQNQTNIEKHSLNHKIWS